MVIKPRFVSLIAFFSLVFLIHELSDWAHTMMAGGLCHCWAPRAFDSWTLCPKCLLDGSHRMLIWIVGPVIIYAAIWTGYALMHPENSLEKQSTGFCIMFAALPFIRIMGAFSRRGDLTVSLHQFFQTTSLHRHHLISLVALAFVLALTLPGLVRAFQLLPGWRGKLLAFPAFLLLPGWIDYWVVHVGMNKLTDMGFLNHLVITGLPLLVLVWLLFVLALFLLSDRGLAIFLDYDEKRTL